MSDWSKKELEFAYRFWATNSRHWEINEELQAFFHPRVLGNVPWIRDTRQALFLSTKTAAARMKITPATWLQLERREKKRSITVKSLRECAAALDCDLVYAFVPKRKVEFSRQVWEEVYPTLLAHPRLRKCDPKKRCLVLAALMREVTGKIKFQRRHESEALG